MENGDSQNHHNGIGAEDDHDHDNNNGHHYHQAQQQGLVRLDTFASVVATDTSSNLVEMESKFLRPYWIPELEQSGKKRKNRHPNKFFDNGDGDNADDGGGGCLSRLFQCCCCHTSSNKLKNSSSSRTSSPFKENFHDASADVDDSSSLSPDQRLYKASMFIEDAKLGRQIRPHHSSNFCSRFADQFVVSRLYFTLQVIAVCVHLLITVFEPPSFRDTLSQGYKDDFWKFFGLECGVIFIYSIEIVAQMHDWGVMYFLSRKRVSRFVFVLMFIIDLALATIFLHVLEQNYLRFSRFVRPFMLLFISAGIRRVFSVASSVVARQTEIMFFILSFIAFSAVIGVDLFAGHRRLVRDLINIIYID